MKTYMFIVYVQSETNTAFSTGYYTNTIMSKNNGALVTFKDSMDIVHSVDPTRISIEMNVDTTTHLAKCK